jgi:hypothetical protein
MKHPAASGLIVALSALMVGCQSTGIDFDLRPANELSIRSATRDDVAEQTIQYDVALYSVIDPETVDVVLIDGTVEAPVAYAHIRMFWRSMPGKTPYDPSATNCSVRYVTFSETGTALYGGGGLLRPRSRAGVDRYTATLRNATLRLLDASEDFDKLQDLGTAILEGKFTVERDEQRTAQIVQQMTKLVSEKLGYPRLVDGPGAGDADRL